MKPIKCSLVLTSALLSMTWNVGYAQTTMAIYSTGFEFSEGFVSGNVDGQNGWDTQEPVATSAFASVTGSAPAGLLTGSGALSITSGNNTSTSPRYAWPPNYGSTFSSQIAAGSTQHVASVSMYLPSGSTSTARLGMVTYDLTGTKILGGFYVQANTGLLYLLGYYNNAGTLNNFAFNTNTQLGYDLWNTVTTTWSPTSGRWEVFWGTSGFFVDGAGAGSVANATEFYATRNGSTIPATVYFDNLSIGTIGPSPASEVPEPRTVAAGAALACIAWMTRRVTSHPIA